ncbi:peptidoglycan recognition family protein [Halioxenophilus sp. WMMB6]|uniref:peptidoglycan recognition protein family protein n=1 Tax=Halioxenophilus sp. WMMB6 TaxID=3073815 RepID=UPI00295F08D7|nr:peptidoglycan recognition family protein [Halioxenophilus sp. WMMB6]
MEDLFSQVLVSLTVAAGGSLLIERFLEILKHVVENVGAGASSTAAKRVQQIKESVKLAKATLDAFKSAENSVDESANDHTLQFAEALKSALDNAQSSDDQASAMNNNLAPSARVEQDDSEMDERTFEHHSHIAFKSMAAVGDEDRGWINLQLFYHLTALGLGIIFASSMDIHLLSQLFMKTELLADGQSVQLFFDEIFSGLVIAGGSQPVHILLRFITTRKVSGDLLPVPEDDAEESKPPSPMSPLLTTAPCEEPMATPAASAPASEVPPQAPVVANVPMVKNRWQPITYKGGVNPAQLEQRNHRTGNPNLIVFHHTAMSSNLGFQAVVDEFLINKGWSTGYHCVIMPDGAIRPFCRWDRVGNHTKDFNDRSLGVAFHGNFHLDPTDKYSNASGRYGIQTPTKEQLDAGARLIALWVHLYDDIALDFHTHILGHGEVKPGYTVCPGSNFPKAVLQQQVSDYFHAWQESPMAQEALRAFRQKSYLYI